MLVAHVSVLGCVSVQMMPALLGDHHPELFKIYQLLDFIALKQTFFTDLSVNTSKLEVLYIVDKRFGCLNPRKMYLILEHGDVCFGVGPVLQHDDGYCTSLRRRPTHWRVVT